MVRPLLCIVALAIFGLGVAVADTYSLAPVKDERGMYGRPAMSSVKWQREVDDVGRMPKLRSDSVWFAELPFADSEPILVALDPGKLERPTEPEVQPALEPEELPIVYLDLDRDRNLDDEEPVTLSRTESGRYEGWLKSPVIAAYVVYKLDDGREIEAPYRFRLMAPYGGVEGVSSLRIVGEEQLEGMVKLDGKSVTLRLMDGNVDAKYGIPGLRGDYLWLDADGDGKPGRFESRPVTKCIAYGGKYYSLRIRPDGGEVTIEPYGGELGKLIFWAKDGEGAPLEVSKVYLYGDSLCLLQERKTSFLRVPPGSYSLVYNLTRHSGGETRDYEFRSRRPIEVVGGEAVGLRCGLKVKMDLEVSQDRLHENAMHLYVDIKLTGEETGHSFGASTPGPPGAVYVMDADGKTVAHAHASYGRGLRCAVGVPNAKAGETYRIRVTWDTAGYQDELVKEIEYTIL